MSILKHLKTWVFKNIGIFRRFKTLVFQEGGFKTDCFKMF